MHKPAELTYARLASVVNRNVNYQAILADAQANRLLPHCGLWYRPALRLALSAKSIGDLSSPNGGYPGKPCLF